MRKWLCSLILFLSFLPFGFSRYNTGFVVSQDHMKAYEKVISLRFSEGQAIIDRIKEEQPENLLVHHIENYIDFLSIFINEDEEEFRLKEKNKDIRLKQLQTGDPNDPYYLFSQAELHLQWALTRIKFEEYIKAGLEINKAAKLLEKNQKRFPDFISNKKSLSILHAASGTIPNKFKGMVGILTNLKGSIDEGLHEIDEVLNYAESEPYLFREEAIAIKALILMHLKNDPQSAWTFLRSAEIDPKRNPLATYILASSAIRSGKNDEAVDILLQRERSVSTFPFYYLDLMLGSAKLSRLDTDADVYIQTYIRFFKGRNYIKDAYRKLAWHGLIVRKNSNLYLQNMSKCIDFGGKVVDEDKSALKEALRENLPNQYLLKARILYDGSYAEEGLMTLENIEFDKLNPEDQVEYHYRMGRMLQSLKRNEESAISFQNCIKAGRDLKTYYACNSALQLGIIHEQEKEINLSLKAYKDCLSMKPDEYKNSLHQKAKAGIKRLKKQ